MQARDETSVADSNEAAFRAMAQLETSDDDFEESDIEGEMQRRRQRGRGGAKTVEEKRVVKAAGDKKRRAVARREQDLLINAGRAPRVLDVLRLVNFSATGELAIGRVFKGRADAALTFAEYCESQRRGTWFRSTGGAAHLCSIISAPPCPVCSLSCMLTGTGLNSSGDSRSNRARTSRRWSACAARPRATLPSMSGASARRAAMGSTGSSASSSRTTRCAASSARRRPAPSRRRSHASSSAKSGAVRTRRPTWAASSSSTSRRRRRRSRSPRRRPSSPRSCGWSPRTSSRSAPARRPRSSCRARPRTTTRCCRGLSTRSKRSATTRASWS
mmetsp:Transcript_13619/g.47519  ORF Transcript_13619/g.47519 Transcript_13619/m.47519 type:complete len:331 (+) Transcript_13619:188-1180(+)